MGFMAMANFTRLPRRFSLRESLIYFCFNGKLNIFHSRYFILPHKPGIAIGNVVARNVATGNDALPTSKTIRFRSFEPQATGSNHSAKLNSILCSDCEGNGAVLCSQCKGTGVNSKDHFNRQLKAGGVCWLCRGKREILCGNCNGAGFMGGFMSTIDSGGTL